MMEKSRSQRYTHGGSSPRMLWSKGATPPSTVPQTPTRSKREAKKIKVEEAAADGGGFVRFLPRSTSKVDVPRRSRSASTSPSAWALSPGRSQTSSIPAAPPVPKSPAGVQKSAKREVRSGMSGVLKYFRQKKVSPVLEEEYHQYRIMYNRLLQWRFANARAEASMAAVNRAAQGKALKGWIRMSVMRKLIMEKRGEIQKIKQDIKMWHILSSEMGMLDEWSRIEGRNFEAVGRVVRKLSAVSNCLPLHHNAQADIMSVDDAMSAAAEVMNKIEAIIMDMNSQVERICFLLTELSVMLKQYKQFFHQLQKLVDPIASLEVEEKSLRVHHIQLLNEVE